VNQAQTLSGADADQFFDWVPHRRPLAWLDIEGSDKATELAEFKAGKSSNLS
jgi:hypothetical protein